MDAQKTETSKEEVKINYLILDTNIISRLSMCRGATRPIEEKVANDMVTYLQDLFSKSEGEWNIAISSVTNYELIEGSTLDEELKTEDALRGLKTFEADNSILRAAARLGCFYKEMKIEDHQISLADKIIAATAFGTGSVIYTTNISDYPAPFFSELREVRYIIEYETRKGVVYLPTYFMQPEVEVLKNFYDRRIKPYQERKKKEEEEKLKLEVDQPIVVKAEEKSAI
ncbi:MAG: hypothetical protein AAB610_02340 [Patescibacteria group bacterium]